MPFIDLNSGVGESFGNWTMDDAGQRGSPAVQAGDPLPL